MTITSLERTLNGEITRAMLDLNFQESSSINVDVVSLTAITAEPTTPDEVDEETDGDKLEMAASDTIAAAAAELTAPGPSMEQMLSSVGR
ncbi:MAG TPA: hypothetical protein EYQ50_10925 [Verrucomicrobiales bacterium]|nr:hypothetical protein [Verrucomicrobiales bacterium]